MASTSSSTVYLAVLDDYASISGPYFSPLLQTFPTLQIDYFPSTLPLSRSSTHPDHTTQLSRLQKYSIISTMRERTPFPSSILRGLPNLKLLLTTGAKNASIDLPTCKELGITVAGTLPKPNGSKDFGPDSTNEQTWALILAVMRNVAADDLRVKTGRDGGWQDGLAGCLAGKTLGVLGLGRLGVQCAVTGKLGFGMNVLCWSSNLTQEKADEAAEKRGLGKGSFKVAGSKKEFFKNADVLSVHYVLSQRSRGIVGREELAWMKKRSALVNTSRGPLIDEEALLEVLNNGGIRGVGLDVFETEPLPQDSPWRNEGWGRDGRGIVVISPHMGYVEDDTMNSWYEQTAENVARYLKGEEVRNVFKT